MSAAVVKPRGERLCSQLEGVPQHDPAIRNGARVWSPAVDMTALRAELSIRLRSNFRSSVFDPHLPQHLVESFPVQIRETRHQALKTIR